MKLLINLDAVDRACGDCMFCENTKPKCWLFENLLIEFSEGIKRCAECLQAQDDARRICRRAAECLTDDACLGIKVVIEINVEGPRCANCRFGKINNAHCELFRKKRTSHNRRFNRRSECRIAERMTLG